METSWRELKAANLWEEALLFLRSNKYANHTKELQVCGGHLELSQGVIEEVNGQIEGVFLEVQQLLAESY